MDHRSRLTSKTPKREEATHSPGRPIIHNPSIHRDIHIKAKDPSIVGAALAPPYGTLSYSYIVVIVTIVTIVVIVVVSFIVVLLDQHPSSWNFESNRIVHGGKIKRYSRPRVGRRNHVLRHLRIFVFSHFPFENG
jgi:hypothetical protein